MLREWASRYATHYWNIITLVGARATLVAPSISTYLPQIWRDAFVLCVGWFLQRWKTKFIARALTNLGASGVDCEKCSVFDKVSSLGMIGLGVMGIVEACGICAQSIFTVGGVGGVATAFAARDVLGNMLNGFSLLFSRRFVAGDYIKAGSIEGKVIEIGLTSTSLISPKNLPVIVLNSLFSSQIRSRASWQASITKIPIRIEDIEKVPSVSEEIKAMVRSNPNVSFESDAPYCYLSRLESSYGELTIGCNLKNMAWSIAHKVSVIGHTSTSLINRENLHVIILNSLFSSQMIVNRSRASLRASIKKILIRIEYIEKVPSVSEEIKAMVRSNPNVSLESDAPYCYLSRLENSYGELTIGCNLKNMIVPSKNAEGKGIQICHNQLLEHHYSSRLEKHIKKINIFVRGLLSTNVSVDPCMKVKDFYSVIEDRMDMCISNTFLVHEGMRLEYNLALNEQGIVDMSTIFFIWRTLGGRIGLRAMLITRIGFLVKSTVLHNNHQSLEFTDLGCMLLSSWVHTVTDSLERTGRTWKNFAIDIFSVHDNKVFITEEPTEVLTSSRLAETLAEFANMIEKYFAGDVGQLPPYVPHLLELLRTKVPKHSILDHDFKYIVDYHICLFPSSFREVLASQLYAHFQSLPAAQKTAFRNAVFRFQINPTWHSDTLHDFCFNSFHRHNTKGRRSAYRGSSSMHALRLIRNFSQHAPGKSRDANGNQICECNAAVEILVYYLFNEFIADLIYHLQWTEGFDLSNILKNGLLARIS